MKRLYEVEIKSEAILAEGKKSFITYFRGGQKKTIVSNVRKLYPTYTDPKDKPVIEITPISEIEYQARVNGARIEQKRHLVKTSEYFFKGEDYEVMGN